MSTLPLATRAGVGVANADPRTRSSLRRLQSCCLLVCLSIGACMLLCGLLPTPRSLVGHCATASIEALMFMPAALGLSLLHPHSPGPATPELRRLLVLGSAWLLIAGGGVAWGAVAPEGLPPAIEAVAARFHQGMAAMVPVSTPTPLLASFLLVQGLLLLEFSRRVPGRGLNASLLTLGLVGLCLLALMGWGIRVGGVSMAFAPPSDPPLTLVTMLLLGVASITECAQRPGLLSVLTGSGIGSRRVRCLVLPALLLPGVAVMAALAGVGTGLVSVPLATTLYASGVTLLGLFVLLREGQKVNRLEADIRLASLTDDLTHLYNRRAFMLLGEQAMHEAHRQGRPLSVLYIDLDRLKPINDTFGHAAGSQLLREFADILRHTSRASDIVARIGGDEFAVVTPSSEEDLARQAGRLAAAVSERNRHGRRPYLIRYSVGTATCDPAHCAGFDALVAEADARMYAEKHGKTLYPARLAPDGHLVLDGN